MLATLFGADSDLDCFAIQAISPWDFPFPHLPKKNLAPIFCQEFMGTANCGYNQWNAIDAGSIFDIVLNSVLWAVGVYF